MDFPALYVALKTIFKVGNCYSRLQGTLGNIHRLRRKVVRILEYEDKASLPLKKLDQDWEYKFPLSSLTEIL